MIQPSFATLYALATPDERISLDERAAILEYDAGFTREQAEAMAAAEFIRNKQGENPQLAFQEAA